MPETLYPRNHMLARLPMATDADVEKRSITDATAVDIKRTKTLTFLNITSVLGMRHLKP